MNKPIGTGWEIDWGHPLARGLALCVINSIDLAQGSIPDTKVGVSNIVRNGAEAMNFGATTDKYYLQYKNRTADSSEVSCVMRSQPSFDGIYGANPAGNYYGNADEVYVTSGSLTNNFGFNYGHYQATAGSPNPAKQHFTIKGLAVYESTGFLLEGGLCTHGFVAKSNDSVKFHVGGNVVETKSVGAFTPDDELITIGFDIRWNTDYINSDIEFIYLYDRALSPTEIKSLHDNPYQFLKQRKSIDTNELSTLLAPMPTANDDTDTVDRGVSDTVTGNVLTNDDITCP